MKILRSYRFEQELLNKISEIAQKEHRSLNNQIEVILYNFITSVENKEIKENQTPQTP